MRRHLTLILAGGVLALAAAACGGVGRSPADAVRVVATTTQVGSLASEIGADAIALTVLLPPGAEAHDFELTTAAAAAVADASLILRSGAGLESWLDDAIESIAATGAIRDMSEGVELRAGATHDVDEHDEGVDPHYWLTGPNAIRMAENVRDALVDAVPAQAAALEERAAVVISHIDAADAEVRRLMDEIPEERRGIVTNHDALGYFIDEYGLRLVGSIFGSLDVAAEPSAGELAELVDTIRAEGVVAIFSESAVNPDLARAIADETGARLVDEPLYVDSLGDKASGVDTLDAMLLHNARVIHAALTGA